MNIAFLTLTGILPLSLFRWTKASEQENINKKLSSLIILI